MDLDEANRRLMAQVEYFSSDDYLREKVAPWMDRSPEERLAVALDLFDQGLYLYEKLTPEARERLEALDATPRDTMEILEQMRRSYDDR